MDRFYTVLKNLDVQRQIITGQFPLFYSFAGKIGQANGLVSESTGTTTLLAPGWRKPAPGMIYAAMHKTGCIPAETLLVGDAGPQDERQEDWQAASTAGIKFEHVNGHFATLDGVIPV